MLSQKLTLAAAAGAAADPVYVDDVFSTFLYDGTESPQTITNGIDLSGEGGMVWAKSRSTRNHILSDTERGTGKVLFSNLVAAEDADSTTITSYNSNGFTMGTSTLKMNTSGEDFCSWTFRKCPGFFDVVTYTGNGTAGRTIAHDIGSTPGMVVVKRRDVGAAKWAVWHTSSGDNTRFFLNESSEASSNSNAVRTASSTTFTVGADYDVNASGGTYVAYIFANNDQSFGDAGNEAIIKCGGYTGNGTSSSSINTITLGFEPQWVMIKRTSSSGDWVMLDTMRGFTVAGVDDEYLLANTSGAEGGFSQGSPTANGFQLEGNNGDTNGNSATFVYIAIRRPHKPPSAGTEVFNSIFRSATVPNFVSGFVTDLGIYYYLPGGSTVPWFFDRLRNKNKRLSSASSAAESGTILTGDWDFNNGWGTGNSANSDVLSHTFRRAPGFFDVVAYAGTGIDTSKVHNLTVVPEMIWVKSRNGAVDWGVYHASQGVSKEGVLNSDAAFFEGTLGGYGSGSIWYSNPLAGRFYVANNAKINASGSNYIAYLFATLSGVSKVGSYTGTGNDLNIDCGFTAGARFVLIKRADSSGGWYVWDTTRGIVAGNDPYVLLNSGAAQVTNTDYIDPLNAGFTVTSSAPAGLNASGGTYIFLAIA